MYIVRDKTTQEILHRNPAPLSQALKGTEVYVHFDPDTMEIGKIEGPVPEAFEINTYGDIVPTVVEPEPKQEPIWNRPLEEQIAEGYRTLNTNQKLTEVDGETQIIEKSLEEQAAEGLLMVNAPFERIENNEIIVLSLETVLEEGLLTTLDHCAQALNRLGMGLEESIYTLYPLGREMKITKNYLSWLKDGQPEEDPREEAFEQMQQEIGAIKAEWAPLKKQILAVQTQLERQTKGGRR